MANHSRCLSSCLLGYQIDPDDVLTLALAVRLATNAAIAFKARNPERTTNLTRIAVLAGVTAAAQTVTGLGHSLTGEITAAGTSVVAADVNRAGNAHVLTAPCLRPCTGCTPLPHVRV